ncbi:MAG: hypothetical protein CL840_12215 [Crocinitomicaceae bacterium]|nr:hypothetical protein [Crocinitomicaceae bacterium]|tara:strand:+ start:6898 stop:7299 length:402 start_codon:yes stop_codon:yes gene_type:complete
MIKSIFKYSTALVVSMLIVGATQAMALNHFFTAQFEMDLMPSIYIPWLVLSITGFVPVFWVQKKNAKNMGFAYLVTSIIKMLAALIYLLPDLLNQTDQTRFYALNFVLVFFFILFFELLYFINLIKNQDTNPA